MALKLKLVETAEVEGEPAEKKTFGVALYFEGNRVIDLVDCEHETPDAAIIAASCVWNSLYRVLLDVDYWNLVEEDYQFNEEDDAEDLEEDAVLDLEEGDIEVIEETYISLLKKTADGFFQASAFIIEGKVSDKEIEKWNAKRDVIGAILGVEVADIIAEPLGDYLLRLREVGSTITPVVKLNSSKK